MKILIVENDRDLSELLEFILHRAGFTTDRAENIPTADVLFAAAPPDLILLDIQLDNGDGISWLERVRGHSDTPVIMLTGINSEDTKVQALGLGADDYVTKPFGHRELLARIRAVLRRRGIQGHDTPVVSELRVGPLTLNPGEHRVEMDGRPIALTVTEFRMLQCLMAHGGSVVSTKTLLKDVWGYSDGHYPDLVRVTLFRLRRKLGDSADEPRLLHTVPGVGVLLKPAEPASAAVAESLSAAG
jgi:DNA-binding response OmpR family regulator